MTTQSRQLVCRFYSLKEVAAMLGVHENTLYRRMRTPTWQVLLGAKRDQRSWRFLVSRVETYCSSMAN